MPAFFSELVPQPTPTPTRLDLYTPIHKALRAWMFDTVTALGRVDGLDDDVTEQALARVSALLDVCRGHILHEQTHMHPPVREAVRLDALEADTDHEHHAHVMGTLVSMVQAVRTSQGDDRFRTLTRLYRQLALFVAENLTHMHLEETEHNGWLWSRFSDAELGAIHDTLVGSIPPREMADILRWMLPSLSPRERLEMLCDMRGKMPPGAFEGVLQLAQQVLPVHDWAALCRQLDITVCLPEAA